MLYSLQAGRAAAAILVMLFHLNGLFNSGKYWQGSPFGRVFDFGHSGVMFFFVLSGFIIAHVHARDLNCPGRVLPYLFNRFRRVYPIYWCVLAPVVAVFILFPGFGTGAERDPLVILSSITLLHFTDATTLAVAWTLYHEVLFYSLFAIAIINRQVGFALLIAWIALSAVVCDGFLFALVHVDFGMGMAAAWAVRRFRIPVAAVLALVGVLAFLVTGWDEIYGEALTPNQSALGYGIASTLIILGTVELERSGRLNVNNAWRMLGDASYVLYLIHYPLLSFLAKLFVRLPIPVFVAYALR